MLRVIGQTYNEILSNSGIVNLYIVLWDHSNRFTFIYS